ATTDQICRVKVFVIRPIPRAPNRSRPQITDHAQQSASATIVTRKNSASATVASFYPRNDGGNRAAAKKLSFQTAGLTAASVDRLVIRFITPDIECQVILVLTTAKH
ncbi:MAG TPA: hypothetical protein PKD64_15725, partial [Pirellulaceae bacterium]|nr:hypothetical protein [Pirellulaceae bacterium]